jgi:hypothetical protein
VCGSGVRGLISKPSRVPKDEGLLNVYLLSGGEELGWTARVGYALVSLLCLAVGLLFLTFSGGVFDGSFEALLLILPGLPAFALGVMGLRNVLRFRS